MRARNKRKVFIGALAVVAYSSGAHAVKLPSIPSVASVASAVTGTGGTARTVQGGEGAFIRAVLADMGAPATTANTSSLAAWFTREFSSWPPSAENNPMATTQSASGASIYNSVGVKNYPTAAEGAQATAETLGNGNYPGISAALRSGRGLCGGGLASEFIIWSGPGGYSSVC